MIKEYIEDLMNKVNFNKRLIADAEKQAQEGFYKQVDKKTRFKEEVKKI